MATLGTGRPPPALTEDSAKPDPLGPSEFGDDACVICMEPLQSANAQRLDGCGHAFHVTCIISALQHNRECPLCRYAPRRDDPDYGDSSASSEDGADDPEASEALEALRVRRRRRGSAIRSTLARSRHGSASPAAAMAARTYRSTLEGMREEDRNLTQLRREVRDYNRGCADAFARLSRERRRIGRGLTTRWAACCRRIRRLRSRHERVADALAREAGFEAVADGDA